MVGCAVVGHRLVERAKVGDKTGCVHNQIGRRANQRRADLLNTALRRLRLLGAPRTPPAQKPGRDGGGDGDTPLECLEKHGGDILLHAKDGDDAACLVAELQRRERRREIHNFWVRYDTRVCIATPEKKAFLRYYKLVVK